MGVIVVSAERCLQMKTYRQRSRFGAAVDEISVRDVQLETQDRRLGGKSGLVKTRAPPAWRWRLKQWGKSQPSSGVETEGAADPQIRQFKKKRKRQLFLVLEHAVGGSQCGFHIPNRTPVTSKCPLLSARPFIDSAQGLPPVCGRGIQDLGPAGLQGHFLHCQAPLGNFSMSAPTRMLTAVLAVRSRSHPAPR